MFGQIPIFRDGDLELAQSGAILRYLARKHDLYGNNDQEAGLIDMIYEGRNELRGKFIKIIGKVESLYKNYNLYKLSMGLC